MLSNLFALEAVDILPLSQQQHVVMNRHSLRRTVTNSALLPLLQLCQPFRTLEEHHATMAAHVADPKGDHVTLHRLLNDLVAQGLLINAQDWLQRLPAPASAAQTDWVLAIMTCDRAALLQRLLASALPHVQTVTPLPLKVLLLDDSRHSEQRAANQRHWAAWLQRTGLPGEYWDREARARLCQQLQHDCSPSDAASLYWLLHPESCAQEQGTPGQNRNLALLLSAGQRLLVIDDDCILTPQSHSQRGSSLQVGAHSMQALPFVDQAEQDAAMQALDINPFTAHLSQLGNSMTQVFAQLDQPSNDSAWLRGMDPITRKRLGQDAAVRATLNATCGDPGTANMNWLYTRPADGHAVIADYLQRIPKRVPSPRLCWRGHHQPLLTYADDLMTTTLTGLDNRLLLPCVIPFGRGEDTMLGRGLQALYPQALFFADSWSLPHQPDPLRYWQRPRLGAQPQTPSPEHFVARAMERPLHTSLQDPLRRLEYVAQHYRTLAESTRSQLVVDLNHQHLYASIDYLTAYARTQASAAAFGTEWQRDLGILSEKIQAHINTPLQLDEIWLSRLRTLSAHYAQALVLWPQLRERVQDF